MEQNTNTQLSGKFLTFFLAGEEYGIQILKVQEIIPMMTFTRVPRAPEFIRGVINLRGKIIPVTDLRLKFGIDEKEYDSETCIIVVQNDGVETGVIVDSVSEVLDIAGSDIEDVPSFGAEVETQFLLGIANTSGRVRLLLDIEEILSNQETINLQAAAATLTA